MHIKKMIAPIVITLMLILYYIGFLLVCIYVPIIPFAFKLIGGTIPLLISGICIYVLIERIKEIRSGEEDDLSKY